ncbi:afadin isoform X3 [Harmonia axyridis]|uniref:afadin isoform X3 n=1 Tax=Harmonia axyridis TaxID=115357 RepID=UPI001E2769B0|nr:afadin isoform X3 [Harmonia axyridis]
MHGNSLERRALEREALRNVIIQWNANRLDLFELSEPNEELEFHGVMRFYFQDSGQKVATKCIRVASDATVEDVIGTLVEKFRPDMRMLSVPSYALYELHEGCPERKMAPEEKPLLVQLNWHVDDREGRFLLKNVDDKTVNSIGNMDSNASFRRKLSKREKKQLKKQEKLSRMKSENGDNDKQDGVAEKLYTELPETSFTRSISNPEAVMRRRRQQKLEKKLQQFRSKDGGPDTGGTLKIYGEALCKDVPYKTLLLSIRDCAGAVVREMLDKYGLSRADPTQWCLVQVNANANGTTESEYVLDDDECPLSILMNSSNTGSIMFHVRRRPADCAPRKRKKKPGALGANNNPREAREGQAPLLVELGPDGSTPHPGDTARTIRLNTEVMEVGSANGIALQLYGPHIQPRHCVITNTDGVTSLTPCHADAHTYVNGQRIHQTTILTHGSLVKFGNSNTYRFLDPSQEERTRHAGGMPDSNRIYDSKSTRPQSPSESNQRNIVETTFDIEGNVETISLASGAKEDSRSVGSSSENRVSGLDRYPRGQDPILPAVLEFPEEPQEQFLARVITHLDVTTPTFRLAPAYTLYLCARYRASTHYRPELTPMERAHKLTLLLQHAAMLIRHTIQDRSTEITSQAFWLANASELLHFLKSDRHVSAFSIQAQDTLADAVQLAFKNLVACLTDELNGALSYFVTMGGDDHPREVVNVLSNAMNLLRKCRVNAALTIQLFSHLFHWISAKGLYHIISNSNLCTRNFGHRMFNRLRNLQAWAESQGLELAAECHLAKILQCSHLLQAPKNSPEDLANLSAACFKLNSMQLGALLMQYKAEPGEKIASPSLLEQASKAAESVADELARAEGREITLYDDPAPPLQLLLPDDGFSCDVVQGVPPGLADFLHPLQASGLCRLAAQPTSSGHWTVYMNVPRPPSALSSSQPEVQVIRLHKTGGGMGLSIVAAKGAGQERLGIYIKSVVPGGAADRDGRLAAGDQLLSVDGQSLLGITQEKAAEFLVRTGSIVTLEVAKGGAVHHGLATLLQQPSPTPHRASDTNYYKQHFGGSQESLLSLNSYKIFTPPAVRPKNNVFFNSADNLYKTRKCKLTIPRIEIECEPVFSVQVTDFSEPCPKNVTLTYDESGTNLEINLPNENDNSKSRKDKTSDFVQKKSYSIEVNEIPSITIDSVNETDKFLSIRARKIKQQRALSSSLQDVSSSTSSISSCVHESHLDLSQIDGECASISNKNWKSPDELRFREITGSDKYDSKAVSFPELSKVKGMPSRSHSISDEHLNDKLTEYERLEILKLLHDWSLYGSDSKCDFNISLDKNRRSSELDPLEKEDVEWSARSSKDFSMSRTKYSSEPNLSPVNSKKNKDEFIVIAKYNSEGNLNSNINKDLLHKCEFRNCIFNIDTNLDGGTKNPELMKEDQKVDNNINKTVKKNMEQFNEKGCLSNITNFPRRISKIDDSSRRNSEIIQTKTFNSQLVRCDSLERLTLIQKNIRNKHVPHKKFPDAYIVKRNSIKSNSPKNKNNENQNKSKKAMVQQKKYLPKTWKSCSDIKTKKTIRKCCKLAKKSCPMMKGQTEEPRKAQSCADFDQDTLEHAARLAELKSLRIGAFDRPRRMSERDLPSKVDSERTIPSSKSVPALHHISPNSEQIRPSHDVFNPGYSRTSSNNSINTNSVAQIPQNAPINSSALRSRSTHNLLQQDNGFYQNLSVYRNKMPNQLGDRTSALRSSQNSLQSSNNSQRPASAYYPPPNTNSQSRMNLHQSIPNLKSPPSMHRLLQSEDTRSGSFPNVNHQQFPPTSYQTTHNTVPNYSPGINPRHEEVNSKYFTYGGHPGQTHGNSHFMGNALQQPLNIQANGHRHEERYSNNGSGLLREDVFRHSQGLRHDDMMRYPSVSNIRLSESQMQQNRIQEDFNRLNELRASKSEDMLKQHHINNSYHGGDIMNYSNNSGMKSHESSMKMDSPQLRQSTDILHHRFNNEQMNNLRGQAKLAEMGEEVRRRQNRAVPPYTQASHYSNQFHNQSGPSYSNSPNYNVSMMHNTQSMQNLNLNSSNYPLSPTYGNQSGNVPSSPTSYKSPPVSKITKKQEDVPEPPPTSTHPLYSASAQDPPKMSFYPTNPTGTTTKTPKDPWAREEQERQAEARREAARIWQEQQIKELLALPHRNPQQEEQLRVLQLEREFQRRALEAEQEDEDTEKESLSPHMPQPVQSQTQVTTIQTSTATSRIEAPPTSILKPGGVSMGPPSSGSENSQNSPTEAAAPPPPERGSSFAVMSMRAKENIKRVSFNDTSPTTPQPPNTLHFDDSIREDPNSFIRQAESMLASPTTPTSPGGVLNNTPGVIGAQEVYKDPRAKRLAEQAQQKNVASPVPEKLSFKEKMKMFAMESGENSSFKDKSKISKAQREIDGLGTNQNQSGMVH